MYTSIVPVCCRSLHAIRRPFEDAFWGLKSKEPLAIVLRQWSRDGYASGAPPRLYVPTPHKPSHHNKTLCSAASLIVVLCGIDPSKSIHRVHGVHCVFCLHNFVWSYPLCMFLIMRHAFCIFVALIVLLPHSGGECNKRSVCMIVLLFVTTLIANSYNNHVVFQILRYNKTDVGALWKNLPLTYRGGHKTGTDLRHSIVTSSGTKQNNHTQLRSLSLPPALQHCWWYILNSATILVSHLDSIRTARICNTDRKHGLNMGKQ